MAVRFRQWLADIKADASERRYAALDGQGFQPTWHRACQGHYPAFASSTMR